MRIEKPLLTTLATFLFALTASRSGGSGNWRHAVKSTLGPRRATLLRCIFRRKKLPRWGNLRTLEPFSDQWGIDRGTPVDRFYNDRFYAEHRNLITGRVLEIQESAYTTRFGVNVKRAETIDIEAQFKPTIVCDIARTEGVLADNSYDCFLLPYTLMFVRDLEAALRNALRVIKPGGAILATASVLSPALSDYPEYWRFTEDGWRELLARAWPGCEIEVETYGNCTAAVASILGLAHEELKESELECNDPRFPVLLTILCRKPLTA